VWSLVLLAFISVKHLVVGWAMGVASSACTILLCLFVWRLLMCWFMPCDRRRRHVSFSWSGQRLHRGEMYCLKMCFLGHVPMYWPYLNLRSWVSLTYVIHDAM
jgi:hypothetical protein